MKILFFTDLHAHQPTLKALVKRASEPDIDLVMTCGDFTKMGAGLSLVLQSFQQTGKKFYCIPGNHESDALLTDAAEEFSLCINFHRQSFEANGYRFLGYGEGGFAQEDARFRKIAREWYSEFNGEKIVFVCHMPPYGTAVDLLERGYVGNVDYRQFIDRIKPKLVVCGHLHETVGKVDLINGTKIVNPGWNGMVIELK
ncbi:metallophosphoesterase family protein [Candidatus Woesearchaeota archaeon]|nr:metallophosphoesterase family protein [Candidatus Woesearchaeota archaeon]